MDAVLGYEIPTCRQNRSIFPANSVKTAFQNTFQIILLTGMPPMRENGDGLVSNLIGPSSDETLRPTFPCK